MDRHTVQSTLSMLADSASLRDEINLEARINALRELTFLEEVVQWRIRSDERLPLLLHITTLRGELESLNQQLFQGLRMAIRTGELSPAALRAQLNRHTPPQNTHIHIGYDALDALINGICQIDTPPQPRYELEGEMVHLEPTPARAILDLLDRVDAGAGDVFYDIGAGLGQVAILVDLLSEMRTKGVEIEPAYVAYARDCAQRLGANVDFIQADARDVDYSDGTIFFLFTPFRGTLLQAVLEKLRQVAQHHGVRVCTYGPCTPQVAQQGWLRSLDGLGEHEFALAIFESTGN